MHPDQVAGLILIAAGPGFRKDEAREQWNASVDASAAKLDLPEGSEVISKHVDSWVIDHLGDITAPALVIVGEHDKRFAASAAVFAKDPRRAVASVVVPDAGHSVHRKAARTGGRGDPVVPGRRRPRGRSLDRRRALRSVVEAGCSREERRVTCSVAARRSIGTGVAVRPPEFEVNSR